MNTNDTWYMVNRMAEDKHDAAAQAVAAVLADGGIALLEITGREYMENLENSGLMDGMSAGESILKILGHRAADPFTMALLLLAADGADRRGTVTPLRLVGAPDSGPEA